MKRYKEKETKKYVIADLSDIAVATKFLDRKIAQMICDECMNNYDIDLVVVPIMITYEILEED